MKEFESSTSKMTTRRNKGKKTKLSRKQGKQENKKTEAIKKTKQKISFH